MPNNMKLLVIPLFEPYDNAALYVHYLFSALVHLLYFVCLLRHQSIVPSYPPSRVCCQGITLYTSGVARGKGGNRVYPRLWL